MDAAAFPFAGEVACLTAAALWAVAVALFRPAIETFGAQTINLAKCALATVLQGMTVIAFGGFGALFDVPAGAIGWVAASGVIGLIIGDTALFAAVKSFGVHRTLLVQTLAPVFAAVAAWGLLRELPTPRQGLGAIVILIGIALVVAPRRRPQAADGVPRSSAEVSDARRARPFAVGAAFATLAAAGQGVGLVLAKIGLVDLPPMTASTHRLAIATLGLAIIAILRGRQGRLGRLPRHRLALRRVLPATLLGTYLAMFLMMIGTDLAVASVAVTLLGTSPIFGLFLEWAATGRRPGASALVGTTIAVAGVALLSTGGS